MLAAAIIFTGSASGQTWVQQSPFPTAQHIYDLAFPTPERGFVVGTWRALVEVWARMLPILGGPLANYAAATVLFFALFASIGHRELVSMRANAEIGETAKAAGVQPGGELVSIAGQDVTGKDPFGRIGAATRAHKGETVPVVVNRGAAPVSLEVPISAEGRMGIGLERGEVRTTPASWGEAALFGVPEPWVKSKQNLVATGSLFTGETKMDQMSGPIGIVKQVARAASMGLGEYVMLMAIISSLLGLFNLLPLPALDGGRILLLFRLRPLSIHRERPLWP